MIKFFDRKGREIVKESYCLWNNGNENLVCGIITEKENELHFEYMSTYGINAFNGSQSLLSMDLSKIYVTDIPTINGATTTFGVYYYDDLGILIKEGMTIDFGSGGGPIIERENKLFMLETPLANYFHSKRSHIYVTTIPKKYIKDIL